MKELIRENKIFLYLFLMWIVAGGILLLLTGKGDEILWINNCHSPLIDVFFKYIYIYIDFNFAPPLFLLILLFAFFRSYGSSLYLLINSLFIAKFIDFLHVYVFTSELNSRPNVFFDKHHLHILKDVFLNGQSGYPAASVAETFAVFFLLTVYGNDKRWSYLFFTLSFLYAVARLYVFQNFFDAVYVGSILGIGITLCSYTLIIKSKYYKGIKWKNRSAFGDIKHILSPNTSVR